MVLVKYKSTNEADTGYYPEFQDKEGKVPHKLHGTPVRTVTMEVDLDENGENVVEVVRRIPDRFQGTFDDYVKAVARGLAVEYSKRPKELGKLEVKSGDVLASRQTAESIV